MGAGGVVLRILLLVVVLAVLCSGLAVGLLLRDPAPGAPDPGTASRVETRAAPPVPPAPATVAEDRDDAAAAAAARFEAEVLGYLARSAAPREDAAEPPRRAPDGPPTRTDYVAELRAREGVDWDYVRQVFDGDVYGVPNESRAGLTLAELDKLGTVPRFEELREAGEQEELQQLGLDLPTDWYRCGENASCMDRPDGQWRPPDAVERPERELAAWQEPPTVPWGACLKTGTCFDRPDGEWRMPPGGVLY